MQSSSHCNNKKKTFSDDVLMTVLVDLEEEMTAIFVFQTIPPGIGHVWYINLFTHGYEALRLNSNIILFRNRPWDLWHKENRTVRSRELKVS